MLQHLKPYVERVPALASAYRTLRDQWRRRALRPRPTPWGFTIRDNDSVVQGRFEPSEIELVSEHLGRTDVLVDVGANVGVFTCLGASRGVHVVAVEPLADNLELLYANLRDNAFGDVEVFPMGLAEAPSVCTLYGAATGASLVAGWSNASTQVARTIAVTTLDNTLRGRFAGRRLFVKMDIEGAEHRALAGAAETLARDPAPTWLVEVCLTENLPAGQTNPHFAEVFERFFAAGYRCRTVGGEVREVTPGDVERWVRNGARDFGSYNFLFTRD